jgi:alpha-N-acetylglucosaminidase
LPAFSGHVPPSFKDKFPNAKLKTTNWGQGFNDVYLLDANDPMFTEIGKKFIEKQTREYGTDHLYSSDTFNENTPPNSDSTYLSGVSKKIFQSMTAADPKAVWVMQGWLFYNAADFWKTKQIKALLDAVPDNQMIILDLYSDVHPVYNRTDSYYGKPWIWCMLQNFGGNVSMDGRMGHVASDPNAALHAPKSSMVGIGLTPEAIEQNPALYELMMDNVWRDKPIGVNGQLNEWLDDYSTRRYGKSDPGMNEAWQVLYKTVYDSTIRRAGPASIIAARPAIVAGDWRTDTAMTYSPKLLLKAWELFAQSADELKGSDGFQYDFVDITRQVMANFANKVQPKIIKAYKAKDTAAFKKYSSEFLQLMSDMDVLLATRSDFLLGKWISEARSNGITRPESDLYEFNARDLVTLWGGNNSPLHEYSNRQWSGLIDGFYRPRWGMFFEGLDQSLANNTPFDNNAFQERIKNWEWAWVNKHNPYPDKVTGNSVETAKKMFAKYHTRIAAAY